MKESKKNIYILSDTKVDGAKNLQLIKTQPLPINRDITSFDALVFTSKNGVSHLDEFTQKWREIPSYAISEKTAEFIKKKQGNLVFTGQKGHGDQFAKELIKMLKAKQTAFIGAKHVVSNLVDILEENEIDCIHIPIYETICVEYESKIELPKHSIIIFSSPSTIECFFRNVIWDETFQAISIGKTTAKYFPESITPIISKETSLQSCVLSALSL